MSTEAIPTAVAPEADAGPSSGSDNAADAADAATPRRTLPHPLIPGLVILRILLAWMMVQAVPELLPKQFLYSDTVRYQEIAGADGRPYRDHDVEYPPVLLGVIDAITNDGDTGGDVARRVIVLAMLADLTALAAVAWGWGERAARRYLLIGLPLLAVRLPYVRLDLISAAMAAWGLALVHKKRPTAGALVLVLGAFTKLWPGVLLGVLVARRRWKALGVACAAGAAGLVVWGAFGGADAYGQVLTMRGAQGWQIESLPGSLVELFTHAKPVFNSGAWRVGNAPALWRAGLTIASIAAVALPWVIVARRHRSEPVAHDRAASEQPEPLVPGEPSPRSEQNGRWELAALASVAGLMATGPLLSPQFVIWLLPLLAIVPTSGYRMVHRLGTAVVVLTALGFLTLNQLLARDPGGLEIVLLRNAALVALSVAASVAATRAASGRQAEQRADGISPVSPT